MPSLRRKAVAATVATALVASGSACSRLEQQRFATGIYSDDTKCAEFVGTIPTDLTAPNREALRLSAVRADQRNQESICRRAVSIGEALLHSYNDPKSSILGENVHVIATSQPESAGFVKTLRAQERLGSNAVTATFGVDASNPNAVASLFSVRLIRASEGVTHTTEMLSFGAPDGMGWLLSTTVRQGEGMPCTNFTTSVNEPLLEGSTPWCPDVPAADRQPIKVLPELDRLVELTSTQIMAPLPVAVKLG